MLTKEIFFGKLNFADLLIVNFSFSRLIKIFSGGCCAEGLSYRCKDV